MGDTPARAGAWLSHVGIAVRSTAEHTAFFRDVLGMPIVPVSDSDGARIEAFGAGESMVELLEPLQEGSPIARFLEKRGPGIHHLCFTVADLEGTLARCRAAGIRLVDDVPRRGAEGKRIAFLHPSSTGGILIELSEP